jgi:hypothetical protein
VTDELPTASALEPRAGWTSARLSLLLGFFITVAVAWGVISWRLHDETKPSLVFPSSIGMLAVAGVGVVWPGGLLDLSRCVRTARRRRTHRDAPWLWDHEWDPAGASCSPLARAFRASTWPAGGLAPLLLVVLGNAPRLPILWIVPGAYVAWWAWRVRRVLGGGTARLDFTRFPYAPGGPATFRFGMSEGGATFESVGFALRRVVERPGRPFASQHEVFDCEALSPRPFRDLLPGPEQFVEVTFDVPADAAPTRLSDPLPQYWALDVVGRTSAGRFAETFLVPIYERRPQGSVA